MERIESLKAEQRMKSGKVKDPTKKSSEGETLQIVAQKMGIGSKDTYRKEKYIVDNKDSLSPEDFADWDEGKLSTNKVYRQLKLGKSNPSQKSDKGKRTDDIVSEKLGIGSRDT